MLFEIMAILIVALAIALILKLHDHLTRTVKFILIVLLIMFAYVAFMNMVSYKQYDLTSVQGSLRAISFHVGGALEWAAGLWPEKTTGNAIEEIEEEKG